MMSVEQLRDYCPKIRRNQLAVDEHLITMIEADVQEYRSYLREPRPQLPPAELAELLPLMGWLILEASLSRLWEITAGYEALSGPQRERSEAAVELIARAADAARSLPWPEFAPRALGAIRAQALAASKRDTESGYDDAWILHQEAKAKHDSYLDSHGSDPASERYVRDLGEVLLQLALAETGTACRTAERVLGQWAEGKVEGTWTEADSARWTQRMYRQLADGAEIGTRALAIARGIEERWGFTHYVSEDRLALQTSYRLPAIMTARAILLMVSMGPEMEALGRLPGDGFENWAEARGDLLKRFEDAYRYIERPAHNENGEPWPLLEDHERSVVQLRLHLALLAPGYDFAARTVFDPCVAANPFDGGAVTVMSSWLAATGDQGRQRGDANVIGSATKPSFIRSVEAVRRAFGGSSGYAEWRREWFELDRYCDADGRRGRVDQALAEADG
ncbi:hypothetical protein [Micromonospora sonneratiae]